MKPRKQLWELKQSADPGRLELYIYGDVEAEKFVDDGWWGYYEASENSAQHFREELGKYPDVRDIYVYINSYGGSVFEGTAIYNQLRRHPAQKTVYIDGFACSVASVIAMAGDRVVMPRNAMMMIHNAYMGVVGNASELRKTADDLDTIYKSNRQAYLQKAGDRLTEEQLIAMMDAETWLTAEDCIRWGLADEYAEKDADMEQASAVLEGARLNLEQRIRLQKSLAAQLRELAKPPSPPPLPAARDVSKLDTTPTPEEPQTPSVMETLKNMFVRKDEDKK